MHCQALIKTACWVSLQDLLTDEKFTRKDIIHIQDPMNLQVCTFTCVPSISFVGPDVGADSNAAACATEGPRLHIVTHLCGMTAEGCFVQTQRSQPLKALCNVAV